MSCQTHAFVKLDIGIGTDRAHGYQHFILSFESNLSVDLGLCDKDEYAANSRFDISQCSTLNLGRATGLGCSTGIWSVK